MARSNADVPSAFSVSRGALVDETWRVFAEWDEALGVGGNYDRVLATNPIGAGSHSWLEIVVKVLRARYEPDGADRPLVRLAKGGCRIEEWRPLLLWHLARQEFLVRDFFQGWLYEQFVAGTYQLRQDDVRSYLTSATAARAWKESTVKRVASGLLQTASDIGLLTGRSAREFGPFHLPENSFLYLLHALWAREGTARRVIEARDWRMFRLDPQAVEQEILRLHQFRRLDYQVAGSLAQLALPSSTPLGFVERMVA